MEKKTAVDYLSEIYPISISDYEIAKEMERQQNKLSVTKDSWDAADKLTHDGYVYVRYNDLIVI